MRLAEDFRGDSVALRAFLRSPARIDFLRQATSICSFVVRERDDLRPRGVMHMLGEHTSRQALDVEIFECDLAETVDQIAAELVAEIPAAIADTGVVSSQSRNALATDVRAAFASGNSALAATQPLGCALGPAGTGDRLAVAQRHQRGKSQVNADAIRPSALDHLNLNVENDIPLSGLSREDRALGLGWHLAVPAHLDLARHADDAELAGLADRQAVTDAEVRGVVANGGAEAGKTSLGTALDPSKERLEALIQLAQHLLLRSARPTALSFRRIAPNNRQRGHLFIAAYRDAFAVSLDTVLKCCVVEATKIAKHFVKRSALHLVRLHAIFVAQNHKWNLFCFGINFNKGTRIPHRPEGRCPLRVSRWGNSNPCHSRP